MARGHCEEKNVATRGECRLILARTRVNGVKIWQSTGSSGCIDDPPQMKL